MQLPEPQSKQYSSLLNEIESGQVKIPQFQREFVWDIKKSADLIDSIIKGYPIGTFIFWRTNERLRAVKNLGNFTLPEPKDGEFVNYVLDGQQRMTSLFACLRGLKIERGNNKYDDYSQIYVDLEADDDQQIVITDILGKNDSTVIKINDLINGSFTMLASFDVKYHQKLQIFQKTIQSYNFSIILLKEVPIDIATEVFTRINVGGKSLTLFEIMVAKTYDPVRGFDLSESYKKLIAELRPSNYETISDTTILQTVSIILEKDCTRKQILKLGKSDFIDAWEPVMNAIKSAVEYFKFTYRVPVSQLLPYNALLIPFSYYFYHHRDIPTLEDRKYLEDFFWRCSLGGRYSSGVESKLIQDIKRIDLILANRLPSYDWAIDISPNFIKNNGWFSAGRSFIKAILCLYAFQQPKSFNTNALVNIGNYWLKQANSKNYHHFFPKAFLQKSINWENRDFWINHILNITIVDDFLNKREISAKAPSRYMAIFLKKNENLIESMKTHLIDDLEKFGIWEDDYKKFLDQRAISVSIELQKRIIASEVDKMHNVILINEDDSSDYLE